MFALVLSSGACAAPGRGIQENDPSAARSARDDAVTLESLALAYDDTIVTESARTVDFNGQAFVPRYVHVEKSGSGADLDVDVAAANFVFGVNEDFTVRLGLSHVTKRLDQPGGVASSSSEGLGDAPLIGKYRFYQRTGRGETTEAAAVFGFELPTGRDGVRGGGMTLPQPLQPGSGSLDTILGGAFTRVDGRWLVNADLIGKINSEANDYRFGNELRADVGGEYRIHPARYERFDQLTVNLIAELNGNWAGRDRLDGDPVSDSGGSKLFATPGVQVILNRYFLLEAAVQIPVVMDLNGDQLEEDFVSIVGLRARF